MKDTMEDSYIQKLRAMSHQLDSMNIKRLAVFGSRLRGDAREDSDLDLLVEFYRRPDLLELGTLYDFLEGELGCKIDIVQPHRIFPALRDNILAEAKYVKE